MGIKNGKLVIEIVSDGLHIYYNGGEQTLAP